MMLPGGLKAVSMALPFAALVGVIAWLLAKRFLPESRCGTFGASGPEKSGAGRGLAGLRAGVETQTATFPGDKRYGWLWIPLARVQDLLLLLVAVVGYMELCYIPIKFIARLLG